MGIKNKIKNKKERRLPFYNIISLLSNQIIDENTKINSYVKTH